jgi:hypothetical protein
MTRESFFAPLEVKFADDDSPGTFEGYGAVFGNIDAYGDVIQKGAFKETLREWKTTKRLPPMLIQHGGWGLGDMDGLAIGKWTSMAEDDTGLRVAGKIISLDTERGKIIHGAMKEGVLDGMSIGYRAKQFTLGTKPTEPRRTLKKIDLVEVSVVQMPANGKARISAVKNVELWRGIEEELRTDSKLNLSNASAVSVVAIVKKHLREGGVATMPELSREADDEAFMAALRRRGDLFTPKG